MAEITCVDGRVLGLVPVPVLGRDGVAYEAVLHLQLDGEAYGVVGERCHGVLVDLRARQLTSTLEAGMRAVGGDWHATAPYLPRDRELLALRGREPDDLPGEGAVRALLDVQRTWTGGRWEVVEQVRVEAWGTDGTGVRALLSPAALLALVDQLLAELDTAVPDSAVPNSAVPNSAVTVATGR